MLLGAPSTVEVGAQLAARQPAMVSNVVMTEMLVSRTLLARARGLVLFLVQQLAAKCALAADAWEARLPVQVAGRWQTCAAWEEHAPVKVAAAMHAVATAHGGQRQLCVGPGSPK